MLRKIRQFLDRVREFFASSTTLGAESDAVSERLVPAFRNLAVVAAANAGISETSVLTLWANDLEKVARFESKTNRYAARAFTLAAIVSAPIPGIVGKHISTDISNYRGSLGLFVSLGYISVQLICATLFIRVLYQVVRKEYTREKLRSEYLLFGVSISAIGFVAWEISLPRPIWAALVQNAVSCLCFVVIFRSSEIAIEEFKAWRSRSFIRVDPSATCSDAFVLILHYTSDDATWSKTVSRAFVIFELERLALSLEVVLTRTFRTNDLNATSSLLQRAVEIGTAVRSLKLWAATPNPETRMALCEKITRMATLVSDGHWGLLESTSQSTPETQKNGIPLTLIIKTVTVAMLPGTTCELFHIIKPSIEIPSYVIAMCLLWAASNLLLAFDATLAARTATFKGMFDVFFPSLKGKE